MTMQTKSNKPFFLLLWFCLYILGNFRNHSIEQQIDSKQYKDIMNIFNPSGARHFHNIGCVMKEKTIGQQAEPVRITYA